MTPRAIARSNWHFGSEEAPVFKNALVSVSNKTGLIEFLKPMVANGLRVVSTGGTLKYLRENGIPAVEVAEQTGFPEVMDGRVKTLHPRIHMALLARADRPDDMGLLKKEGLDPFDLVVVNLYPFEEARRRGVPVGELIEFIDIGGPSLLRAAAKNHERLTVICDPEDYDWVASKPHLTLEDRRSLAARVYRHTSRYDELIAKTLASEEEESATLVGRVVDQLRYGENPQQKAWWFRTTDSNGGLHEAKILHGKPLSYNNLLDLDAASGAVREFQSPAAVAVKHNNPCGVGTGSDIATAVVRAIDADPMSVFGGILAMNRVVDLRAADEMARIFLECVIAPGYDADAFERLKKKKDLRILEWSRMAEARDSLLFRSISGGYLVQTPDSTGDWSSEWKILGDTPPETIQSDLVLSWKVCARLKSNAIAIVSEGGTVGLGMGQVNRVDAVQHAIDRMRKHHPNAMAPVLASDAFFPFPDSIELAAQAGVRWVIQPGGSIRDEDVLARARELGVTLVLTGTRHFRH